MDSDSVSVSAAKQQDLGFRPQQVGFHGSGDGLHLWMMSPPCDQHLELWRCTTPADALSRLDVTLEGCPDDPSVPCSPRVTRSCFPPHVCDVSAEGAMSYRLAKRTSAQPRCTTATAAHVSGDLRTQTNCLLLIGSFTGAWCQALSR